MFASKDAFFTNNSGYTIARSVRFRSSASAYFSRTQTSGNRKTYTYSAWVKRGNLASKQNLFGTVVYPTPSNQQSYWSFLADNTFEIALYSGSSYLGQLITTQVFRDPSAWYHIVVQVDTTQATSSNRLKLFVNGTQVTSFSTTNYPAQNTDTFINTDTYPVGIGRVVSYNSTEYFDGYMTEINFIDGQALTPSSFGETDSITGVWKAKKYAGTYGTNGFYLNFSDNSSNTATTIGKDYSGNGNNWTPNNISVTAGSTYDSMVDSPTVSAVSSNYAVLNPLIRPYSGTTDLITYGNLRASSTSGPSGSQASTITFTSGKFYCEATATTVSGSNVTWIGVCNNLNYYALGTWASAFVRDYGYSYASNGKSYSTSTPSGSTYGATYTSGDVIGLAIDADAGTITFYKNGTTQGTAFTGMSYTGGYAIGCTEDNSNVVDFNFGQRPFSYTPPTGFVALNTYNLPASTITNGAAYMAATTYTGNLTGQSITNSGNNTLGTTFQPDLVWIKSRSAATDNKLTDSVRGATKALISNTTGAETTDLTGVTAINSNGFTVGASTDYNNTGVTYVGWQWKAGGTSSSNTNGSITSTVSVNATAGFSVVTYTGTGANATVGHGLGVAPSMIIVKNRDTAGQSWLVYHTTLGATQYLLLESTAAVGTASTPWNNTAPTATVFNVGTSASSNESAKKMLAYCFAAVAGYSAFGSYTGNGSADGPFIYTGFRPRFVMWKSSSNAGTEWVMYDTSRSTYNVMGEYLLANQSSAGASNSGVDFLSNGFKLKLAGGGSTNTSGYTYIYMAFAENPFKNSLAR